MATFVVNKQRRRLTRSFFVACCVVLLCRSSCLLEAFTPRFHTSLGQTIRRHHTTTPVIAFSIRLRATRRQNPEYEVLEEGEDDESELSMQFDDDDEEDDDEDDDDLLESFDDIDVDDEVFASDEAEDDDEFEEEDDEEEDEEYDGVLGDNTAAPLKYDTTVSVASNEDLLNLRGTKILGALFKPAVASSSAGAAIVSIQVGDVSLARKAWKKRRRSGSPILVPCSVLSVDPKTLMRSNFMYILYKYGEETKGTAQQRPGLELSMSEVAHYHRRQFNISLVKLAQGMGYDSPQEMVENVMDETFQQRQGIYLLPSPSGESNNLMLWTPLLSRRRAHQRVNEHAVVLEFALDKDDDSDDKDNEPSTTAPKVRHTGRVQDVAPRQVTPSTAEETADSTVPISSSSLSKKKRTMAPLSAALRVNSQASLANLPSGSIHSAVVFGFDSHGDGGFPLLTLSLALPESADSISAGSPQRATSTSERQPSERERQQPQLNWVDLKPCEYALNDLQVGQGPLEATVVHVSKTGIAFVDAMVGRRPSSTSTRRGQKQKQREENDLVPVVGMLRKQDAIQLDAQGQQQRSRVSLLDEDDLDNAMEAALSENDEDWDEDEDDEVDGDDISFLFRSGGSKTDTDVFATAVADHTDEEGDEESEITEEDVTHLFELQADGSLLYQNPETGETEVIQLEIGDDEEDEEEEDDDEADDNDDIQMELEDLDDDEDDDYDEEEDLQDTDESRLELDVSGKGWKRADMKPDVPSDPKSSQRTYAKAPVKAGYKRRQLKVGDKVQVYIKAISKQSGRFMVTMDPEVRKPKEVKREYAVEKKLARLAQQLGGSLDRISQFRGRECSGIVKATSQTSDWLYVQPQMENLPVGVATLSPVLRQSEEDGEIMIQAGDAVRIRLDGIDEDRGQLAMTVLEKLAS